MGKELNHLMLGSAVAMSLAALSISMTNSYADTNLNKTGTITTNALNVRSGPSTSYNKLGLLSSGTNVEIITQEGAWYKIRYKNDYGYISSQYVKLSTASSDNDSNTNSTIIDTGTTTENLNIRKGSSTSYSILGKLSKGTKVNIVEKCSNGWYKIQYNSNFGYISGKYVTLSSTNSSNNTSITIIDSGVITATLNIRSGSSTSYSILGKLTLGTKINILEKLNNGWYKIQYNSSFGYVSGEYVTLSSTNSSNNTSSTSSTSAGKTSATVNVRSSNSTSSSILMTLPKNSKVTILGKTSNSWFKVQYGNSTGYIHSDYISASLDKFLFVGDSYTYLLTSTIKSNASNTTIRAKSGCVPSYWLNNFSQLPDASSVNGISLLLGVNGMNASQYSSTVSDMKTLITKLVNKYPGKIIYVQRVFPLATNFSSTTLNRIITYNNEIKSYCNNYSNVKFIDTTYGLVTDNGYLKYPDDEGIHIIPSKYQTFYNNISQAVLNTY